MVNIQVTQKEEVNPQVLRGFPALPFLFGPGMPQGQQQVPQEFYRHGAGSGFVWDQDGHIITNNHVVDGADKITVTFYDDTTVPGEVIGTDADSDLAVIKVDRPADQLQPVQVADSTQAQVGQLVVAIGNPFALEGTMHVFHDLVDEDQLEPTLRKHISRVLAALRDVEPALVTPLVAYGALQALND